VRYSLPAHRPFKVYLITEMHKGIAYALLAAVTFGGSTPFAKLLVGQIAPVELAGLLYLGSGLGLLIWFVIRNVVRTERDAGAGLKKADMPWLGGAIVSGGIAGPVLLMYGLTSMPAAYASLLLNMEGVLTALLAWFVFKENFDRRIFIGMLLIIGGGIVLSWEQRPESGLPWGALAIIGACLCWGIDNNFTRKISAGDAVQIAGIKGLAAGVVNLTIALSLGASPPSMNVVLAAGLVGFCGYGLSFVFFVLALRHLGTARTGAYFSVAPFVGAIASLILLGDVPTAAFWIAGLLMGVGIWLHVTERHGHRHTHVPDKHAHQHTHDEHHRHEHDFAWDGEEPHVHPHRHQPLTHNHPHFPDIHHRHTH
jgi:drug/metabolite transporter (DMT)-like permease